MIDLTPLDVRKKRGDFRKGLRGYEPQEVDTFLELVAERMEELVRENLTLTERAGRLAQQVQGQEGRERAVQDALVTAQELREEIRDQARKEAENIVREAESEAERILAVAEKALADRHRELRELSRERGRFLKAFRLLLEREMDVVEVEERSEWSDDLSRDDEEKPASHSASGETDFDPFTEPDPTSNPAPPVDGGGWLGGPEEGERPGFAPGELDALLNDDDDDEEVSLFDDNPDRPAGP